MKRPILLLSLLSALGLLAPDAHAVIDTNANGLSDLWEKTNNNGNLYSETYDPQADPDQDGWTNAQEAAAGTDPNNPNPPDGLLRPDITHVPAVMCEENGQPVVITPETVVISWVTTPGKQYTLLYSPDLSANSWLPVDEPFIGTGFIREFGFPNADANRLFLRVAISDADSDNDGLTDAEEHTLGTNSLLADSDGDGSNDFDEIANATLPLIRDTDEDGVLDGDEASTGTDPLLAEDLDDDNMPDDWEKFMSTSLLEIFPDPAHWGVKHAHLVNQDLEPAQSYTSDGLTAIDVCNVMVNTEDAGNGEGIQFEWQEKEENFIGVHNSESETPYSGTGHSSSPEWSRNFSTSEYGDSSGLTSSALLTRQSALSWAPVAVRNPSIGDYKPLFTAFPYELYEPERIGTLGIHAHCNYYTYSISDTASGMNGRKKSFRVRLASRKPVAEATTANWLRIKYTGQFNNSIDPDLIDEIEGEETEIDKGGMFSDWVTVGADLPTASQGAGAGNNVAEFSIPFQRDEDVEDGKWQSVSGNLAKALPGQRINLRMDTSKLPANFTASDFQWELPGKTFKDYEADNAKGKLTLLQPADLSNSDVHFYFVDSGDKEIKLKLKVNQRPVEAKIKIKVENPVSSFTTIKGAVRLGNGPSGLHSLGYFGQTTVFYGVNFVGSVTTPKGWPDGRWVWAQLIRSRRNYTNPPNGAATHLGDGVSWKLDSSFPYFQNGSNLANGTVNNKIGDSPSDAAISAIRTTIEITESFETYLMFRPDGTASKYVPLRKINWNWGGKAGAADSWANVTNPVGQADAVGAECTDHPQWTDNSINETEQNGP